MGPYFLCTVLILMGLYGIFAKKNLVKIVIGTMIVEYGVNLLLILTGYRYGGTAPVVTNALQAEEQIRNFVDPLPQALILTAIVIGLGTLALIVAICLRLYEKYGTFDILQIRRLKG